MAKLMAEMTIKIHPEMSEEGKAMLRQMIREELRAYLLEVYQTIPLIHASDETPRMNTQSLEIK